MIFFLFAAYLRDQRSCQLSFSAVSQIQNTDDRKYDCADRNQLHGVDGRYDPAFCISIPKNQSILNSKNSHITPTVIEKQNAKKATKYGDILMENLSLRLKRSINANPMAAIRKPHHLDLCSVLFQLWISFHFSFPPSLFYILIVFILT